MNNETQTTEGHMESGRRVKMAVDFWSKLTGKTGTVVTRYAGLGASYIIEWDDATLGTSAVLEKHLVTIDAHPSPDFPEWDDDDDIDEMVGAML